MSDENKKSKPKKESKSVDKLSESGGLDARNAPKEISLDSPKKHSRDSKELKDKEE